MKDRIGVVLALGAPTVDGTAPSDIAWHPGITRETRIGILKKLLAIDTDRYAIDRDPTILTRLRETRDCLRLLRVNPAVS